jgi:hypothetical protein
MPSQHKVDSDKMEQLNMALAKRERTLSQYEEGVKSYERHIVLLQEYLDGTRKSEFDRAALLKEIDTSRVLITQLRVLQTDAMREADAVRQQLEDSVRETQNIVIHLTPKTIQ